MDNVNKYISARVREKEGERALHDILFWYPQYRNNFINMQPLFTATAKKNHSSYINAQNNISDLDIIKHSSKDLHIKAFT